MRAIASSIVLTEYQQRLADDLNATECVIFLDTNVLASSFQLNDVALREFMLWLDRLGQDGRLAIPAWTAHEYNHHLRCRDPAFFLPHKATGKQLQASLDSFDAVAHLLVDDDMARTAGHRTREEMLSVITEAASVVRKHVDHLAQQSEDRKSRLVNIWESVINKVVLKSDVARLATEAATDAVVRFASRLSPAYRDASKVHNSTGDLIIWRELLACCASRGISKAVLITNDRTSDWVYTPLSVVLPQGNTIDGTSPQVRTVTLPNPDLAAEFSRHTDGGEVQIVAIAAVVAALSSNELNRRDAGEFRHLAMAIKLDLRRTPTEAVVSWFLKNREAYDEAINGVCKWKHSPQEVDPFEFEAWTIARLATAGERVDASRVEWGTVFGELFC